MIDPKNYYIVQGWMISELGLKGNALAAYAIIYGFSQDGNCEFTGSARYLAEWLDCSRSTIMEVLKKLVEQGYLTKRDSTQNGVKYCAYAAVRHPVQNPDRVSEPVEKPDRISDGDIREPVRGCTEPGHNNTRDNIDNKYIDKKEEINKEEKNAPPSPPKAKKAKKKKAQEEPKEAYGEFKNVMLTAEELRKLQERFPDWKQRIEELSFGIASKGYKYASHYAAILNWERMDRKRAQQNSPAGPIGPNGIVIDPTKNDLDGIFR